jgi:hypothetical protein
MSDKPFMTGPRDMGPSNPPPWPKLVIAGLGMLLAIVAGTIGVSHEWIADVYVRGPCALLTIIGFMFPVGLAADGYDQARARGEDI